MLKNSIDPYYYELYAARRDKTETPDYWERVPIVYRYVKKPRTILVVTKFGIKCRIENESVLDLVLRLVRIGLSLLVLFLQDDNRFRGPEHQQRRRVSALEV
jgi:hypothetical protein